VDWGVILG